MADTYDITATRGDTYRGFTVNFMDENNLPISLLGATIKMQARQEADSTSVVVEWDSTIPNNFAITGAGNNQLTILPKLIPANAPSRMCVYDLQITFPSGMVQTWLKGKFIIEKDVTR